MKGTTSDWFTGLGLRAMKDLVCMLFDIDNPKLREHRHYGLFVELRRHLDDEYHGLK